MLIARGAGARAGGGQAEPPAVGPAIFREPCMGKVSLMKTKPIEYPENVITLLKTANKLYKLELKRHNDASHPLNILLFLVDNDFQKHEKLRLVNQNITDSYSQNGFTVVMNIPKAYGGTGKKVNTWIMCDLPILTYISIKLNNGKILPIHKKVIDYIGSKMDDNGWRCSNCGNIGKFRGPGRKEDECPMATLNVLKLFSLTKKHDYSEQKEKAIDTLLTLWKDRKKRRPYLFAMGTDFCKLKYPLIWYDILNVVNTLSYFPSAIDRKEFKEMVNIITVKTKQNGYKSESVFQFWKDFDFGQKKVDSEYIRSTIQGIMGRISL
jgi:hypothetical protein